MNRRLFWALFIVSGVFAIIILLDCSRQTAKQAASSDDMFVPFDEAPVQIKTASPVYPPEALNAGITGEVLVKALIDKNGVATNAIIARDSGKNVGFEQASLDAAFRTKWKPAMSKGKPIAVWVTYKIEFNFK